MTCRLLIPRLAALLLALFLCAGTAAAASAASLIRDLDNKTLETLLEQQKGRPVIINFFATWCPPCRAEIPLLVEMHKKYGEQMTFIGVTVDDNRTFDQVAPFVARMGIGYRVYRAMGDVVRRFGITSIPFNVGFDKNGQKAFAYSGLMDDAEFEHIVNALLK